MIKAGQRDNTNDYCPDCGWFDEAMSECTCGDPTCPKPQQDADEAQSIADALVEAGILLRHDTKNLGSFYARSILDPMEAADTIISDWRTAGACLERDILGALMDYAKREYHDLLILEALSLALKDPRAICEAFARNRK